MSAAATIPDLVPFSDEDIARVAYDACREHRILIGANRPPSWEELAPHEHAHWLSVVRQEASAAAAPSTVNALHRAVVRAILREVR